MHNLKLDEIEWALVGGMIRKLVAMRADNVVCRRVLKLFAHCAVAITKMFSFVFNCWVGRKETPR